MYPSVTQILSPYSGLEAIPEHVLRRASERGTAVHAANARHALALWGKPLPEDWQGYHRSYTAWHDEYVEDVLAVEEEFEDPVHRFVGHPDLVCRLRHEPRPVVVDGKTPVTEGKTWRLQLAGYLVLVRHRWPDAVRGMALMLRPDGKPARAIPYPEDARDVQAFLALVHAHNYIYGR